MLYCTNLDKKFKCDAKAKKNELVENFHRKI